MKKLLVVIAAAVIALTSVNGYSQEMPPAKVVVAKVRAGRVSMTNPFVGTIDFEKLSDVATEVPGKVASLNLTEGAFVREGDVLLTIDTSLLVASAEVLKSQIAEKTVKMEDSARRLARAEELRGRGVISQQDYEKELYDNKSLASEAETLRSQLARLELEIEKSTLRAPFDGIVMEKKTDIGEWVKPDEPVCSLASTSDVHVRVAVPEDIVRFVSIGDRLNVNIEALGRELEGRVDGVVPVADVRSRNFTIKVKVPWFRNTVRNMSAVVHVPVSPKMELRLIKRAALVKMQGKDFVYTVKDGKAAILPVNVAAYLGEEVGVDNPYITAGMPVVVEGNERLMPDQPVEAAGGK